MCTASSGPPTSSEPGCLTPAEFRRFERAERFFWSVRCHLHIAAGRAEERLSFEYQPRIAQVMHYADRPGKSAVERFMQFYFLNAKTVGDLTGVFLAQLDEQLGKKGFRFALPTLRRKPKRLGGFTLDRGRLSIPADDFSRADPVRLLELFALAARERLEIHPAAMRAATRDAALIERKVRDDPRANALFMEVLTTIHSPEVVLRWMNETGVFGRFVPDFGRVVAQMQFDMYHHYTVDEHSIRAIGLLAAIERGELKTDHPLSTAILQKQIASRRVLYVAVLLHDIAKGRGGDHSEIGAEIALRARPALRARSGRDRDRVVAGPLPSPAVVDRVQARPRRSQDDRGFRPAGAKPRAAPAAAGADGGRHPRGRSGRVERVEADLAAHPVRSGRGAASPRPQAAWPKRVGRRCARKSSPPSSAGKRARSARIPSACPTATGWPSRCPGKSAMRSRSPRPKRASAMPGQASSPRTTATAERPGSASSRPTARACSTASARGSPRPAPTSSTRASTPPATAWRSTICWCSTAAAKPYSDKRLRGRLVKAVEAALLSDEPPPLPAPAERPKSAAFKVPPSVAIAERASTRTTVVEVNAHDRAALLAGLAGAIHRCGHRIHSAHIATYGERAVDVFYLTRADGKKLERGRQRAAARRPCSTPRANLDWRDAA